MKATDLRKSILQAAVQGKLVPQDKNDEPASELLKRIQAEKFALIKDSKLKREKSLTPITTDEIPYDLPDGWVWCRFGYICSKLTDGSHNPPPNTFSGFPVISAKNIKNGKISFDNVDRYTDESGFEKENLRTNISVGDIIMGIIGGSIGNIAVYTHTRKVIAQRSIAIIKTFADNCYVVSFLQSPLLQKFLGLNASGTAQGGIYLGQLNNILFPLPPLAEQRRIVAKVDELMFLCDELEAAEKELNALESRFFVYLPKSILQAAVQGKLVPQDKNDEPASELLKRIQAEKAKLIKEGKLKKEKSLPPIAEDEIPYDLPEGWVWCHIGNIVITNPRNSLADDTMVTFLPMSLISQDYFGGHKQDTKLWKEVKSGFTHFAEGDVLLAKITPCFQNGKSCIAHNLCSGYGAGTTELHVLRSILVDSRYLLLFLKCPIFIKAAEINMTGTAGQQRVPTDYLRRFLFPLPPFAEQQRIVAKVDELMTLCDELKCVDKQPIYHSNVISFPTKTEPDDAEPIKMAAQGKVVAQPSKQHTAALNELLGMMDDD